MPTSTDVTNLKINQLTEAQYDTAVQGGVIGANELSILTDAEVGQTIQVDVLPTASVDELGKIYQFVGTTDSNYTNGYFYKCVSDGAVTPTYSWVQTDVQPAADPLPSQSGQSGKYLTTNGTSASWATISALQNLATGTNSIAIGNSSISDRSILINNGTTTSSSADSVCIGYNAKATGNTICIGSGCQNTKGYGAIYIGKDVVSGVAMDAGKNSIALGNSIQIGHENVFFVNISGTQQYSPYQSENCFFFANTNGRYVIVSADGTIPTDRFTTTPSADGTYVPTLTVSSGVATRSWETPASGGSAPTLTWYTVSTAGSTLTIADTSSASLVKIYKNGLLLEPTADYSISGTTLTMVTALVVGDKITTEVF